MNRYLFIYLLTVIFRYAYPSRTTRSRGGFFANNMNGSRPLDFGFQTFNGHSKSRHNTGEEYSIHEPAADIVMGSFAKRRSVNGPGGLDSCRSHHPGRNFPKPRRSAAALRSKTSPSHKILCDLRFNLYFRNTRAQVHTRSGVRRVL